MKNLLALVALGFQMLFFNSGYAQQLSGPGPSWGVGCSQNGGIYACHKEFTVSAPYWRHNQHNDNTKYPTEQATKDAALRQFGNV